RGLRSEEEAAVVMDAAGASTDLMLLSWRALARARTARRVRTVLHRLSVESTVGAVRMPERFVVRLRDAREVQAVERAYVRHTNGGEKEGFFTRNIRRFSIPLSTRLVRLGVTANQVTLAGFALAVAAGVLFAAGSYWSGVIGALFYAASMV